MFTPAILDLSTRVLAAARLRGIMIVTAESCTGGLIAGALTSPAGASSVFERGFVTYSNAAKSNSLGVPAQLIAKFGAVSAEVAGAMALGTLPATSATTMALAVTGIAGPEGGSVEKPVGLVWFGRASSAGAGPSVHKMIFSGDRTEVRLQAVEIGLTLLLEGIIAWK